MAIKKQLLSAGSDIYPKNSLDNIVAGATDSTPITSGGKMLMDFLAQYVSITDFGTSASATITPGKAYRFNAVGTSSHYVAISGGAVSANKYGRDAHIQLMVGSAALVHFVDPLVLMNPLTPFAAHDITIKFRDGMAQAYVDDINAGYTVNATSGTTGSAHIGTLYYGLKTAAAQFLTFDAEHNGTAFKTGTAYMNKAKYLHGEGIGNTIIMTSGGTVATGSYSLNTYNLSLGDFTFTGNLVLNESEVQSGAAVTGGTISFNGYNEVNGTVNCSQYIVGSGASVTGNGSGVISGNNSRLDVNPGTFFGGIMITGYSQGSGSGSPAIKLYGSVLSDCVISGNTGYFCINVTSGSTEIIDCIISNNTLSGGAWDIFLSGNATCTIKNSTITGAGFYSGSNSLVLVGSNRVLKAIRPLWDGTGDTTTVFIGNGAVVDFTGSDASTIFSSPAGIVVSDGCTIVTPAGSSVHINGGTYTTISREGVAS